MSKNGTETETDQVAAARKRRTFELPAMSELRIISLSPQLEVTLKRGRADVFGAELMPNVPVVFGECTRTALSTFHGCELETTEEDDDLVVLEDAYVSDDLNVLLKQWSLHQALSRLRKKRFQKRRSADKGPRVVVFGNECSGKSSLCLTLANWACRCGGFNPITINLDVDQNGGLMQMRSHSQFVIDGDRVDHGGGDHDDDDQLVFHYGFCDPRKNPELYTKLISQIALNLDIKCDVCELSRASGAIIDTFKHSSTRISYQIQLETCRRLKTDFVVVIDHERLYQRLKKDLGDDGRFTVVSLPKSPGVVHLEYEDKNACKRRRIHQYFYGRASYTLFPHSFSVTVNIDTDLTVPSAENTVKIFQLKKPSVPTSCMPIADGVVNDDDDDDHKKEEPTFEPITCRSLRKLVRKLLAVSNSTSARDCLTDCVAGYVLVQSINEEDCSIVVLSPAPLPLPNKILLYSETEHMLQQ